VATGQYGRRSLVIVGEVIVLAAARAGDDRHRRLL